jgi:hypothetical protein
MKKPRVSGPVEPMTFGNMRMTACVELVLNDLADDGLPAAS